MFLNRGLGFGSRYLFLFWKRQDYENFCGYCYKNLVCESIGECYKNLVCESIGECYKNLACESIGIVTRILYVKV